MTINLKQGLCGVLVVATSFFSGCYNENSIYHYEGMIGTSHVVYRELKPQGASKKVSNFLEVLNPKTGDWVDYIDNDNDHVVDAVFIRSKGGGYFNKKEGGLDEKVVMESQLEYDAYLKKILEEKKK